MLDDSKYADGSYSLTRNVTLLPGNNTIYQINHYRSKVWTFVDGEGIFVLDGEKKSVKTGDTVIIPVEHFYSIEAITKHTFIEVIYGQSLVMNDIERIELARVE